MNRVAHSALIDTELVQDELVRDGFSVVPGLLRNDLIDVHLTAYEALHQHLGVDFSADFYSYSGKMREEIKRARHDFHRDHSPTLELLFDQTVLKLLEGVFCTQAVLRQPETGMYNRRAPLHTDSLDVRASARSRELRMWCALEDIHPDSGPIYFLRGSHRTIAEPLEDSVIAEKPEFLSLLRNQMPPTTIGSFYEETRPLWLYVKRNKLPRSVEEQRIEPAVQILRKGDIILFSPDVLHGTMQCVNAHLTRKYMVAYWSAIETSWFQARSCWSRQHDYRFSANAIAPDVHCGSHGMYIEFEEFQNQYATSFTQAVITNDV